MARKILKRMGEGAEILAFYKFIVGLPDKKGAEVMGISLVNYRTRVSRIRRKLEKEIVL